MKRRSINQKGIIILHVYVPNIRIKIMKQKLTELTKKYINKYDLRFQPFFPSNW